MTTAIVDNIELFFRGMDGWAPCPRCKDTSPKLISTTNEYDHYCAKCDIRYTSKGEIYTG